MGYVMFNGYKVEETKPVSISSKIDKLYFIQIGVYSNLEEMKQKLSNLENYTYTKEKELYHVYVGITKKEENKKKLEEYFDNLLKETNDEKAIETICNQILNKYEELVVNAESKGNTEE